MVVRAPFGGVVISKDAQPGEMISPVSAGGGFTRTGIGTIVDMSSLEIEVDVNETYINRVTNGMKVEAVLDAYQDWKIPAHVITTIPTADRPEGDGEGAHRVRRARPADPAGHGREGLVPARGAGRRARPSTRRRGCCVPKAAIRTADGQSIVFVVKDDRVERRAISVAPRERRPGGSACSGVSAGERVVVDAPADAQRRRQGEGAITMSNALVTVRDLHKVFQRGGQRIDVLQGVNLDIPEGDFLALMGPSGSGKTTLLNLIGGLDTPSEGSITVAGDRIDKLSGGKLSAWRARHIGFVFQLLQPAAGADGGAERRAAAAAHQAGQGRPPASASRSRCRSSGWPSACTTIPRQLSGGQEQRVGIARAIVTDPTLLLCDEPTGDLDRKAGDEILDLLQALNRDQGKTIVMVTHDPHAAARAKRTLHLDKGVLVHGGGRHEVLSTSSGRTCCGGSSAPSSRCCRSSSRSCCSAT